MSNSLEQLCLNDSRCLPNLEALKKSESLTAMVWAAWLLGMSLATFFVEQELAVRAVLPTKWPTCPKCHCCLRSKGRRSRQIQTLVGRVHWKRRVGRCPTGCKGSQLARLDVALGVKPHQQTSLELVQLGCLLAVFVPFHTVTVLLKRLTGVQLNQQTIWSWVQSVGAVAMRQLQQELVQLSAGVEPRPETLSPKIASMPLVIGADGVMVPMRPHQGKPDGKTLWREVKVAILVRLGHKLTRRGKNICQLHQRRLVAVLGDIDALRPRLMLEALQQRLNTAGTVVWLSDGGRGFWRLYQECFSPKRDRYFRLLSCCPESLESRRRCSGWSHYQGESMV